MELTTFNSSNGEIKYAVQAGRITKTLLIIDAVDMEKLRALFVAAQTNYDPQAVDRSEDILGRR